jgi:hypothetical protein
MAAMIGTSADALAMHPAARTTRAVTTTLPPAPATTITCSPNGEVDWTVPFSTLHSTFSPSPTPVETANTSPPVTSSGASSTGSAEEQPRMSMLRVTFAAGHSVAMTAVPPDARRRFGAATRMPFA